MFLAEGFGTLDESTLDVVASTWERLATESDRVVGIVTHVPALAERVPVQFAVTREGSTSRLRRVEAG
jgi:exonuclease SbcC